MKEIKIQAHEVKSQSDAILWHLKKYGSITSYEAIKEYGATRLSAIIFNHRKDGYNIDSMPLQCGHFQSRRHMATRFDETNCQPQCVKCNMFEQGEQFKFHIKLNAKYGEDTSINLQHKAMQSVKFTRVDYNEKISYYKSAVDNLKKQKEID